MALPPIISASYLRAGGRVADYSIEKDNTLHLVLRLRAGRYPDSYFDPCVKMACDEAEASRMAALDLIEKYARLANTTANESLGRIKSLLRKGIGAHYDLLSGQEKLDGEAFDGGGAASNSSHALAQSASAVAFAALEENERELQHRLQNTLSELAAVTSSKFEADAVIQQLQQQLVACDEAHAASESAAAAALAFNQSEYDALQQQLTDVEGLLSVESLGKADAELRFDNALIAGDQVVAEFAAFKELSWKSAFDAETKSNLLQQELLSSQNAVYRYRHSLYRGPKQKKMKLNRNETDQKTGAQRRIELRSYPCKGYVLNRYTTRPIPSRKRVAIALVQFMVY